MHSIIDNDQCYATSKSDNNNLTSLTEDNVVPAIN